MSGTDSRISPGHLPRAGLRDGSDSAIVPIFSVGCERGVHFYAMQFIYGQPLKSLFQKRGFREGEAPAEP